MEGLYDALMGLDPVVAALVATTFTWLMTAAGASLVFFFKTLHRRLLDGMLGFTGGVMVAASCFGLLIPAMDMTGGEGWENVMPAAVGFAVGALFLYALDKLTPHLHINFDRSEAEGPETDWHRTTLLVLAITLHNIPEGLAVGVLFGGAAAGIEGATIGGAVALAIGIGIQNFPEGIAVSMPLRRQGGLPWTFLLVWAIERHCGACSRRGGGHCCIEHTAAPSVRIGFCGGGHDLCRGRGGDTGNATGRFTDVATLGFIGGFVLMMVPRRGPGLRL